MKTPFTRRHFIKASTLAAGAGLSAPRLFRSIAAGASTASDNTVTPGPFQPVEDVSLNLLDGKALSLDSGVSFGVPWPQGAVRRDSAFSFRAD